MGGGFRWVQYKKSTCSPGRRADLPSVLPDKSSQWNDADFKERFRLQIYAFHKFFVLFYPIFCCICRKNGLHLRLEWVFPFHHNYAFRAPVYCAGAAVCVSPRLIKITSKHAQISFFSGRSAVAYSFGSGTIEKQTRAPLQHIAPGRPDAFGK